MEKINNLNEFKALLLKGYTNEQLATHYKCGITTIKRFKSKNNLVGLKNNSKPLSLKQIEEIQVLTDKGLTLQQVVAKTGKTDYLIKKYLPKNIYTKLLVNTREAFSINLVKGDIGNIFIANEYSAYICGVLQSDGYLTKDGYIGITAKDKDFVQTFAKFFKAAVREINSDIDTYYQCRFKDIRNLEKFKDITNIYPNKTYTSYKIPSWIKTNEIFLQYFIAGVFDGDGWVYKVKDRDKTLECGIEQHILSKEFLEDINQYLNWNVYFTDNTFRIHTKAHDKVKSFYDWYSQIEYAMLRKISVFDSVYL